MPIKSGFSLAAGLMNVAALMNEATKGNRACTGLISGKTDELMNYTHAYTQTHPYSLISGPLRKKKTDANQKRNNNFRNCII